MRNARLWAGLLGIEQACIEKIEYDEDEHLLVAHVRRGRAGGVVVGSATDAATAMTRARAGGVGGRWTWGASRRCLKRTRLGCPARPMA